MALEVEVKAPCSKGVEERLRKAGAKFLGEERQEDSYFNHPARDFRKTDEALRIRKVGDKIFLTYKGPKLSKKTKLREEFEIPVGEGIRDILARLGFRQSITVSKTRRHYRLSDMTVCVDEVDGLGCFIEAETGNPKDEEKILSIMKKLGIPKKSLTTKSYMELLEEKSAALD